MRLPRVAEADAEQAQDEAERGGQGGLACPAPEVPRIRDGQAGGGVAAENRFQVPYRGIPVTFALP